MFFKRKKKRMPRLSNGFRRGIGNKITDDMRIGYFLFMR